jgi:hypothetical protein
MAGKFVELNDAAKMIGVTPDELVEMRSRGEIFGYRDGASWKFKLEEVERVIGERGSRVGTGESAILSANDEDFESLITGLSSKILADKAQEEAESVLVSEEELGVSTGKSTIIGKGKEPVEPAGESDLKLADEGSVKGGSGTGSDKLLEAPGSKLSLGGESDVLGGSDLKIASGSGTGDMPMVPAKGPGSTGGLDLGSKLSLGEDDDLELGSSDSALDEEIQPKKKGSGAGSDVTLGAGDSGINLSPTDSGLSLDEEPLDLVPGGSSVESLELPEDDEVISLEQEAADPDQATQLKADQDFQLSPAAAEAIEDESDSGSQVIALEDSEAFDQDAATMLKSEPGGPLAADAFQPMGSDAGMGMGAAGSMGGLAPAQPMYVQVPVVEAPYSIWNVLSLMAIALMLSLGAMMMVDVMLNMWSFSGSSSVTTGIMDMFTSTFGLDNT